MTINIYVNGLESLSSIELNGIYPQGRLGDITIK